MANFLTWATDVLEKVDQSAATLSDASQLGTRRTTRVTSEGSFAIPRQHEGHLSDSAWQNRTHRHPSASDGESADDTQPAAAYISLGTKPLPLAALRPRSSNAAVKEKLILVGDMPPGVEDGAKDGHRRRSSFDVCELGDEGPQQFAFSFPKREDGVSSSSVQPSALAASWAVHDHASASGLIQLPHEVQSAGQPFSAVTDQILLEARATSSRMESFLRIRAAVESREWVNPEAKKEFEGFVHKANEDEAKISLAVKEIEKIRMEASMKAAMESAQIHSLQSELSSSQALLVEEKKALTQTLKEAQARQGSLQEEMAECEKALVATKKQAERKAKESADLSLLLPELATDVEFLAEKLTEVMQETEKRDVAGKNMSEKRPSETAKSEHQGGADASTPPIRSQQLEEKKAELASWETKIKHMERELALQNQALARLPSAAQREKDLERRLRGLSEQLLSKQGQAENLASEVSSLQHRLEQLAKTTELAAISEETFDLPMKRNKYLRTPSQNLILSQSQDDDPAGKQKLRQGPRNMTERIMRMAQTVDALSLKAGVSLQRSSILRALAVFYVVGLHFAVLVILSFAAHHHSKNGNF